MGDIEEALALSRERFGIEQFHPLQRLAIANILEQPAPEPAAGEAEPSPSRQVVILPTGAGKSLCFQAPALVLKRPTLVLYPLIALMEDQLRRLALAGVEAALFRGGQSPGERAAALTALRSGRAPIALANPEVLASSELRRELADIGIDHLAIDEAHCVSEWGETFRPAYLEIGAIAEVLRPRFTSAFTATASPLVLEAVTKRLFGDKPWHLVAGNPDRPNIHWSVLPTLSRYRSLFRLLENEGRPLIVFASSRRGVEKIAAAIRSRRPDLDLRLYHAGLEAGEKRAIESWFLGSDAGLLVATCAYGMGVDKKNIRTVIHWEAPASVEAYLQEAGRSGRDSLPARAILLLGRDEGRRAGAAKGSVAGLEDGTRAARRAAFLEWALGERTCRRKGLLTLLGAGMEGPCQGCDICDGGAPRSFEGEEEIFEFVSRHRRRWNREEVAERLCRATGPIWCSRGFEAFPLPFAGSLSSWRREEVGAAIRALLDEGRLTERKGGPWKGRLEPGRASAATLRLFLRRSGRGGRSTVIAGVVGGDHPDVAKEGPDDKHGPKANKDAPVRENLDRQID
ncbi:MAG TPA: RecQ family ATP-dependent DNA helicase [Rectinemataceae bacterium]|nr:RecQ family ATP-dependent DNA helicase [Rectinemataceae bacterium]